MKKFIQWATAALLAVAAISPAQALVIGTADEGNSIPFGSTLGGYVYQQVYNKTDFSASLNIHEITFYNSLNPGGTPRSGNFDIYLSVTPYAVGALPFDFPEGFPGAYSKVYSGALPALADNRLDFDLSSSFNYDPALGNLLMIIVSFDFGAGSLYLDADKDAGAIFSRRFSAGGGNASYGLVTGFNDSLTATPLPAALPLFASGIGLTGLAVLRRKRKIVAA